MMKLIINAIAADEIDRITAYIRYDLRNPKAARRIRNDLFEKMFLLKRNPFIGKSLSDIVGDEYEDLRYIIVKNYLVIYRLTENEVIVIHIIDGRTDYMRYLLSMLP